MITQNVDGLHPKAGSQNLTELHGSSHRVNCLDCKAQFPRQDYQEYFRELNPTYIEEYANSPALAPDADAILEESVISKFNMATCKNCGSNKLKPDIVFFGDNVKVDVVDYCYDKVDTSDLVLVMGSTMQVYSSYRFALRAKKAGIPIISINIGDTRADKFLKYKLECNLCEFAERFS